MAIQSAGILLWRRAADASIEVLLVHPGGPLWAKKDLGAWSIPKGVPDEGEELLAAARREYAEETGGTADGPARSLASAKQPGGKIVHVWAVEGDFDPTALKSNTFEMEWPPKSRRLRAFPEVDRAAWFALDEARRRILPGQAVFLDRVTEALARPDEREGSET